MAFPLCGCREVGGRVLWREGEKERGEEKEGEEKEGEGKGKRGKEGGRKGGGRNEASEGSGESLPLLMRAPVLGVMTSFNLNNLLKGPSSSSHTRGWGSHP